MEHDSHHGGGIVGVCRFDRKVIRDTAAKLDISNVMATRHIPGQGMAFDETGRIAMKYRVYFVVVRLAGGETRPRLSAPSCAGQALYGETNEHCEGRRAGRGVGPGLCRSLGGDQGQDGET